MGAVAAALFAGASFFAATAGVANAAAPSASEASIAADCPGPDMVKYTHYKGCDGTTRKFVYIGSYNPVPHILCYKFDTYWFACNAWYYQGVSEACTH
ncbi:hypothetical protein LWC34_02725 [Kibdelosporangium philippinense]|uniref:Chitin-binding type-2 domain-containing protein n=2 Tax=Kibdelosporangium philippinense TaxID=211113 RepID=A0ABS8Z1E4_9PSEU|nr:hypothetical protein [Kibdelosporangium philippinense]MCE7001759.1 hypothetical protein [Kibdelosporangium philippinense]